MAPAIRIARAKRRDRYQNQARGVNSNPSDVSVEISLPIEIGGTVEVAIAASETYPSEIAESGSTGANGVGNDRGPVLYQGFPGLNSETGTGVVGMGESQGVNPSVREPTTANKTGFSLQLLGLLNVDIDLSRELSIVVGELEPYHWNIESLEWEVRSDVMSEMSHNTQMLLPFHLLKAYVPKYCDNELRGFGRCQIITETYCHQIRKSVPGSCTENCWSRGRQILGIQYIRRSGKLLSQM